MSIFLNLLFTNAVFASTLAPTPFPVFLKTGFSTILEFDEAPTQVVLGDPNVFQIEKLGKAVVLKPLATYATTNMFVYFKANPTRLFILTATEEAEPTYYKKFSAFVSEAKKAPVIQTKRRQIRTSRILKATFDEKKDFLTIDFELSADGNSKIVPNWELIRLRYKDRIITASKLWSERQDVQRDTTIRARAVFTKPNVPFNRKGVALLVPLKNSPKTVTLQLGVQ